jgi:hypothetical protein
MESIHHEYESESLPRPSIDNDAELERDYQELAQWLIEVYLWELEQERKNARQGTVDSYPQSRTI